MKTEFQKGTASFRITLYDVFRDEHRGIMWRTYRPLNKSRVIIGLKNSIFEQIQKLLLFEKLKELMLNILRLQLLQLRIYTLLRQSYFSNLLLCLYLNSINTVDGAWCSYIILKSEPDSRLLLLGVPSRVK